MHFRIRPRILAAALAVLCPPLLTLVEASPAAPKVLFIGNSLTFYNTGVDSVLRDLSASLGNPIDAARKTNPGWTLQQHFEDPATHQAIKSAKWDYVVLQELSDGTLADPARFRTYSAKLDSVVRSTGSRSVFFMTWTYSDQRLYMGDSIAAAYNSQGRALGIPVVPVGWAWQRILDGTGYAMYADDRHPTFRGTYLAASLFYAQFTGKDPSLAPYRGVLAEAEAAYLRIAAYEAWQDYQRRPYALPGTVEAERFLDMQGVATEATQDEGGGRDLAYIQPGDWFEFPVDVKEAGRYKTEYRLAALSGAGRLEIATGGKALDTVNLPVTGGFQAWRTQGDHLVLAAGPQVIRFNVLAGGFNLNWVRFTYDPDLTGILAARPAQPLEAFRAGRFDFLGRRHGAMPAGPPAPR